MPTTPILGLPYPAQGDTVNIPQALQDLAEAVEAAMLNTQVINSGLILENGWILESFTGIRRHGLVTMHIGLQNGSPPTVNANGNIAGEPLVGYVPVGFRPAADASTHVSDGLADGDIRINPDGTMQFRNWTPGHQITTTGVVRLYATYLTP